MSCFQMLFSLEYCLYETFSIWECLSLHFTSFCTLFSNQKSCALCDNCLVYSTSLVSNYYLGSNKCSVENNFHFLVNVLNPIALMFRLLSVWNIIQLRMSIFTLHVISPLFLFRKAVLCEITVLYTVPL